MSHLEQVKGVLGLVETITVVTWGTVIRYRIREGVLEHCWADDPSEYWQSSMFTVEHMQNWSLPMPESFIYNWVDHPHRLYLAGKEAGWW